MPPDPVEGDALDQQLRAVPFFRHVDALALGAVEGRLQLRRFAAGTEIFHHGDAPDALYLIRSGQVEVFLPGSDAAVASLGPGSFVGEIGMLLGEPRSASLRAVADTEAWALDRPDLEDLLAEQPGIALEISRELGRRLVATNRLVAAQARTPCTAVWGGRADDLAEVMLAIDGGRVAVVELPGAPPQRPVPGVTVVPATELEGVLRGSDEPDGGAVPFDHVVVVLPEHRSPASDAALRAAGHVVVFAPPAQAPDWLHAAAASVRRIIRCDGSAAALRRAARWVTGRAVGLALSSGGSKCVAHVGVAAVLRELGVEIDAVAGTSGGALVGAAVALSMSDDEMVRIIEDIARLTKWRHLDYNVVPRSALSKGARIRSLLDERFGGRTFQDVPIPFWAAATDVRTGEQVVVDRGPLADGLRASMSVPGAFDPWPCAGRLCIDGAVVDPLPAGVLREAGVRWVIASSVAGREIITDGPRGQGPGFLQIVSRLLNAAERGVLQSQTALVDVLIRPDVKAANTFDFSRYRDFIAVGADAARRRADELAEIAELCRA